MFFLSKFRYFENMEAIH